MYISQTTVDRIREIREKKGISATELNKTCDLSKNTIATSANSKNGLSAKILFDISKLLDCSADYLLGITDNPNMSINFNDNSLNQNSNKFDSTAEQFVNLFNTLSFEDKTELMNFAVKMKNKEK